MKPTAPACTALLDRPRRLRPQRPTQPDALRRRARHL